MKYVNGGYVFEEDEHCVMTGPIQGAVTVQDGTTYDVSPLYIAVSNEHAAEVVHLIGERYAAEGHPDHDEKTPFVHEGADERFANYEPHPDNDTLAAPKMTKD